MLKIVIMGIILLMQTCGLAAQQAQQQQTTAEKGKDFLRRWQQRDKTNAAQCEALAAERKQLQAELAADAKRKNEEFVQQHPDFAEVPEEPQAQAQPAEQQQRQQPQQPAAAPISQELQAFQAMFLRHVRATGLAAELEAPLYKRTAQGPALNYDEIPRGLQLFLEKLALTLYADSQTVSHAERAAKLRFFGLFLRGFVSPQSLTVFEQERWAAFEQNFRALIDDVCQQASQGASGPVQAVIAALGNAVKAQNSPLGRQLFSAAVDCHRVWWQRSARYLTMRKRGTFFLTTIALGLLSYYGWKYREGYYE